MLRMVFSSSSPLSLYRQEFSKQRLGPLWTSVLQSYTTIKASFSLFLVISYIIAHMVLMNVTINKLVCVRNCYCRETGCLTRETILWGVVKMSYFGLLMSQQYSQLKSPPVFGFLGLGKVHPGKENVPLSSVELHFFFNLYFPKWGERQQQNSSNRRNHSP